jgi:serine/threonine protein kinase
VGVLAGGTWIDDRYRVERLLGRGGVADVVRAHDAATGDAVAVKLLRSDDDRSRARFRAEIEVLAQLDHPGVVRLLDAGWHDARPYLVLDLVDGPTLAGLLLDGPLGEERSVTIGGHLGAVLAYAHGLGVVHRDLKPSNVLFEEPTQPPRLADFGLARLADATRVTETGACVGTAAYLAPEQLEGRIGPAADVFSLGLVVIECLTGALCYPGTVAEAALARLHRPPIVPADLPAWLGHMLRAMTDRHPDRRPDARAVAEAFRTRSAAPLPTAPHRTVVVPFGPRPDDERRRIRRPAAAATAAAALLAVLAVGSLVARDLDGAEPRGPAAEATSRSTTTAGPPSTTAVVRAVAAPTPTTAPPPAASPTSDDPPPPGPTDRGRHGRPRPPEPSKDHPAPQGPAKRAERP